jgi:hypothetical protein
MDHEGHEGTLRKTRTSAPEHTDIDPPDEGPKERTVSFVLFVSFVVNAFLSHLNGP